ncbi:MAG TPA: outer membrane beta-barrel protein, partial [Sphingomicrobium sp.]|nr:outer membrane beta-barrel protein [Sphingomicrobium sp.]
MKKQLLTAVAALAVAAPAVARDGAPYIGIEGGILQPEDTKFDIDFTTGTVSRSYDDGIVVDYKRGLDIGVIGGYDLGMFRVEGELAHKRARISDITPSTNLLADIQQVLPGTTEDDFESSGRIKITSLMVNGLVDLGADGGWAGYFGGGIGRAWTSLLGDRDSTWAWQAIAGFRAPVSDNIDVGLKYRFFNTSRLSFEDNFDGVAFDTNGRFRSHSLLASLIYN